MSPIVSEQQVVLVEGIRDVMRFGASESTLFLASLLMSPASRLLCSQSSPTLSFCSMVILLAKKEVRKQPVYFQEALG